MNRIVIVGLGLIGGSIALALRRALPSAQILGIDRPSVLDLALERNAITASLAIGEADNPRAIASDMDLVVLALPVGKIVEMVGVWLEAGRTVCDTGSTKKVISERAHLSPNAHCFVPSHPMAGRAEGGLLHADPDLFRNRPWIVCPEGCHPNSLGLVSNLANHLGANLLEMEADEHDRAVATTSHAPQLIASWLATMARHRHALAARGPAFDDMTRIAGGQETMWEDIFHTNSHHLSQVLALAARQFSDLASELGRHPPCLEGCLSLLREARKER